MMVQQSSLCLAVLSFNLMSLVAENLHDNQGKEFILGFMENYRKYGKTNEMRLFVTTSIKTNVHVEVTSPKWNSPYMNESFTITAGQVKELDVDSSLEMNGTGLSTKGILVKATHEVTVYGMSMELESTDGFLALPTDVLGTNYFAVVHHPSNDGAQFLLVGTEDNTRVNIFLSYNINNTDVNYNGNLYKPGDVIDLVINRYDTFQVQNYGDLSGSYAFTDKPIAFFSGSKRSKVGSVSSTSHLVEQLTPLSKWGYKFATTSIPKAIVGAYVKVIAGTGKTNITYTCDKHGNTSTGVIELAYARDFAQISMDYEQYCYLESTAPILVVQYTVGFSIVSRPTMIMIPPIEQYGTDYRFTTFDNTKFTIFFVFIARKMSVQRLTLDGKTVPNITVYNIPKTDLIAGTFEISEGVHTVVHTSYTDLFYGFLTGQSGAEAFGFPTNIHFPDVNASEVHSRLEQTQNDTVENVRLNGTFKVSKENVSIQSAIIWQKARIVSDINCARFCLQDPQGAAFSYYKGKQLCRGYGSFTYTTLAYLNDSLEGDSDYWTLM